jgi:hypothetical protein
MEGITATKTFTFVRMGYDYGGCCNWFSRLPCRKFDGRLGHFTKYVWDKEYKENYYKVFPKMLNGKTYYVTIKFGEGKVDAKVVDTSWVKTKNHLGMMKNEVFPQCVEHKSIKLSFEMRVKMDIVKKLILESSDIESLKVDVKKVLQ